MDAGATLVKLADRLHNMETIKGHPSVDKRRAIAEETRKFFIPLANLLKQDKIEARLRELVDEVLRA
jgi:(p)ppGpp synthase/HD superfamily hydrolase